MEPGGQLYIGLQRVGHDSTHITPEVTANMSIRVSLVTASWMTPPEFTSGKDTQGKEIEYLIN